MLYIWQYSQVKDTYVHIIHFKISHIIFTNIHVVHLKIYSGHIKGIYIYIVHFTLYLRIIKYFPKVSKDVIEFIFFFQSIANIANFLILEN